MGYYVKTHLFLMTGNIPIEYCRVFYYKTLHRFYFVWALYWTTFCSFYGTSVSRINTVDINTICVALNFMSINYPHSKRFLEGARCILFVFSGCPRGTNQRAAARLCVYYEDCIQTVSGRKTPESVFDFALNGDKKTKFILLWCQSGSMSLGAVIEMVLLE